MSTKSDTMEMFTAAAQRGILEQDVDRRSNAMLAVNQMITDMHAAGLVQVGYKMATPAAFRELGLTGSFLKGQTDLLGIVDIFDTKILIGFVRGEEGSKKILVAGDVNARNFQTRVLENMPAVLLDLNKPDGYTGFAQVILAHIQPATDAERLKQYDRPAQTANAAIVVSPGLAPGGSKP